MPYCLKCGTKIEDTMAFCPECGTNLKDEAPSKPTSPEPSPKQDKSEAEQKHQKTKNPHEGIRHQKLEYGFIKYLVVGLVLVTVGVSAELDLTDPAIVTGTLLAVMLLTIGLIVILGSVYYAVSGRKHGSVTTLEQPTEKKPA